jgi:ornithine cyclodeaminase/alanine dehydrogenase-like protein (mu-crystallin family)
MELRLLSGSEVQQLLDLNDLLDALAEGFKSLSEGRAVAPNRIEVSVPDAGFLLAMPAWQPDQNIAVKIVTVFHGNIELGIPGHQALICVFDPKTGTPAAIMDGTYITAIRTAGGAALSAKLLARSDASVLTIIGAGVQGRSHLRILPLVRNFEDVRVASLRFKDAQELATMHARARAVKSYEEAVRGADVVCLCTTSSTPVIEASWLAAGTHITSVGHLPPGGELPNEVIRLGRLFVETRLAFEPTPIGCDELAGLSPEVGAELGEVLLGRRHGRQSSDEITVYKSMGHAIEDMVAANLVYQRATQQGIGHVVEL